MRVSGSSAPPAVHVEVLGFNDPDYCEVRITENVERIGNNNYVYDEYVFHKNDPARTLEQEIRSHLQDWLETGRGLEVQQDASILYHMEEEHTQELADLVEMIYEDDLEVIG